MAIHNEIGKIGEDIATLYFERKGLEIVQRNYRKKWGEIDIVAHLPAGQAGETEEKVHFVEVKSVSYETKSDLEWAVPYETYRPEEQVHRKKQERLKRAIQTWIGEKGYKGEFQIDILVVYLVPREKYSRVKVLENVIFE